MSLTSLPAELLNRIFARTSVSSRCVLACTCTKLTALLQEPRFWEDIELDVGQLKKKGGGGLAAMLHFLAKRVTLQTRMKLSYSISQQEACKPAAERSEIAHLCFVPLLMGVGTNPGLRSLDLDLQNILVTLQAEILRVLPWMNGLRELRVSNIYITEATQLNALNKLSDLESLELEFNPKAAAIMGHPLQGGFPERLGTLTKLQRLSFTSSGPLGQIPEGISALRELRSLELSGGSIVTGLPESMSKLTALSSVRVEHLGQDDLTALATLPTLRELHLSCAAMPTALSCCSQLTALTLLLANVPEHQIEMGFSCILGFMQPPASEGHCMRVPRRFGSSPPLHENLRVLHIADTKLSSVPQAVTQLRYLEHLSLTRCSLFDLPVGPYTKRLKTLGLKHNFFIEIPHTLALPGAAPELRKLDISHNLLRPSETDIGTVLQLPSLQHLWVTKTLPQPGPERFRQSFTSWTAYSMDCLFKLTAAHAAKYPARPLNIHVFEPSPAEL